jgi:hypothetical protein
VKEAAASHLAACRPTIVKLIHGRNRELLDEDVAHRKIPPKLVGRVADHCQGEEAHTESERG